MTDAPPRFGTGDERLRGRYLFATLLANVDELTITTPETGDDESAVVRSPVLNELQRVTGIDPKTAPTTAWAPARTSSGTSLQRPTGARQSAAPATEVTSPPSRPSARIGDSAVRTTGARLASPNTTAC